MKSTTPKIKKDNKITPIEDVSFDTLFREAGKTKRHNLTPEDIEAMDREVYD